MVPIDLLNPWFPPVVHEPFDLLLHVLIGYTAVTLFTDAEGWVGALGGLVPNLDEPMHGLLHLPVEHGGVMHTPLLAGLLALAGYLVFRARPTTAAGFAVGSLLELAVDLLQQTKGYMLLYPLSSYRFSASLPFSELYWGSLLYVLCFALLFVHVRNERRPAVELTG